MVGNNETKNIYEESIKGLKAYLKIARKVPNEATWNAHAIEFGYLSSKSIGFLSSNGFNKLCRELLKQINREEGRGRRKRKAKEAKIEDTCEWKFIFVNEGCET